MITIASFLLEALFCRVIQDSSSCRPMTQLPAHWSCHRVLFLPLLSLSNTARPMKRSGSCFASLCSLSYIDNKHVLLSIGVTALESKGTVLVSKRIRM